MLRRNFLERSTGYAFFSRAWNVSVESWPRFDTPFSYAKLRSCEYVISSKSGVEVGFGLCTMWM